MWILNPSSHLKIKLNHINLLICSLTSTQITSGTMDGPGAAWVSWEMLLFSQILKCCCLSCICIWGICIWGICIWGICICNWGLLGNVVHLAPQVVLLLCYCWCFFWSRSCRTPSTRSGIPTSDFPLLMYKLLPTVYKILQYRVLKSSTFAERKASFFYSVHHDHRSSKGFWSIMYFRDGTGLGLAWISDYS